MKDLSKHYNTIDRIACENELPNRDICLPVRDWPEAKEEIAVWFHERWHVPLEAYRESIIECLGKETGVPQWYVVIREDRIIAGCGVIENDFHERKDLAPNVCAVYVDEEYRNQGIAGFLLQYVCEDMSSMGYDTLYLLTDHIGFYERYGWQFLCMVRGTDEELSRMYVHYSEPEKPKMKDGEPLEIERKFLIRFPDLDRLEQICSKKMTLVQTYLASEEGKSRRIRKTECDGNTVFWYNEKEKISDMTRIEREREISEKEYTELIKEAIPESKTIHKTRYCIPVGECCFEVDIFPEWEDRAFAEVELENEQQNIEIPECLSVIKEVTEDCRYTNRSLALYGFVYDDI